MKVRLFDEENTKLYDRIKGLPKGKEIFFLQGGTESSKTVSIMKLLARICINPPRPLRRKTQTVTVFGEDMPNLKVGALRDFQNLITWSPLLKASLKNPESQSGKFVFHNGTVLEFVSYDTPQDAQSGKRDWSYAYECKGIPHAIFDEIEGRTDHVTFACFNPTSKFWAHRLYKNDPRVLWDISTYLDNQYASEKAINKILKYKEKWENSIVLDERGKVLSESNYWKNKWRVHGLGLTGVTEGVIYDDVQWISRLPQGMKYTGYAMDFGYNDPTTLIKAGLKFGNVNASELMYKRGLVDEAIVRELDKMGFPKNEYIIADSASPKAIATLRNAGYLIRAVQKPKYKKDMIDLLLGLNINITRQSSNWLNEQEEYKWRTIGGEKTDTPIDGSDHLWDALGYWAWDKLSPIKPPRRRRGARIRRRRVNR